MYRVSSYVTGQVGHPYGTHILKGDYRPLERVQNEAIDFTYRE